MYKLAILLIACYMSTASALPPCVCARDFTPVCGSDGQTYPNNCMLECAALTKPDLKLARGGSCEQDLALPQSNDQACICTFEFKPVCGIDGTTYPNQCALGCEKSRNPTIEKLHDGRCQSEEASDNIKVAKLPTCTCTRNLQPVCGTDGVTYNNICLLKCAAQNKPLAKKDDGPCGDTTVQVVEEPEKQLPKENCVCFRNYKPVCGSDGKTYANSCVLGCASNDKSGLTEVHRGRC